MRHTILLGLIFSLISTQANADHVTARVTVRPDAVIGPLRETLFGANSHPYEKALLSKPDVIERVRKLGIKSLRFPNGCVADQYNWKNPRQGWATVDEWLDFCDAVGAEPYYTVNMQGGTEGLAGPAPANLPMEETIKYQHLMPNPCGNTDYHFGTLAETLDFVRKYTIDRARAGRRPILHYELGNENWGQSTTDWPPAVYAKTIEVYAKAIRKLVADASLTHNSKLITQDSLYIVAVGYPVMGNNMQLVDTPDRAINIKWTSMLNKLHEDGVIDAVQEHFYPYASADGGALAWSANNLHNIILARKGVANDRLKGYRDPAIAYNMPMEHTEWNTKCWGSYYKEDVQLSNPGFEDALNGWTVSGGSASASVRAARRGAKGLRVELTSGECEVSQVFTRPDKSVILIAGVWVRTATPDSVKIRFVQENDGEHKGAVLGGWRATAADTWERVVASARPFEDTRQVRLALRVEKPAIVYFDEARLYHSSEERGQVPISATTYEQQLFCVDALREMALGGCPRAHIHHLFGSYPCGVMAISGEAKNLAKSFELFAGAYGDQLVKVDCDSPTYSHHSAGNPWATDFNALAPDRDDIPMLAAMASRKGRTLYLLLINRSSDRDIEANIDLGCDPSSTAARVRTLSGEDIDLPGAKLTDTTLRVGRAFTTRIAPYSAEIVTVEL